MADTLLTRKCDFFHISNQHGEQKRFNALVWGTAWKRKEKRFAYLIIKLFANMDSRMC